MTNRTAPRDVTIVAITNPTEGEPPSIAKCSTCGGSLYIVDRDDDNLCDECWATAEKISFEEDQRQQREISRRGF